MTDIIKVINSKDGVIHGKETNENEIKTIVKKINEMKPDIVVFTGDLLSNSGVW